MAPKIGASSFAGSSIWEMQRDMDYLKEIDLDDPDNTDGVHRGEATRRILSQLANSRDSISFRLETKSFLR